MRRTFASGFAALVLALAATASCRFIEPAAPSCSVDGGAPAYVTRPGPPLEAGPSLAEARAFFAKVDTDLRRLWVARDRASWSNQTNLTDDTDALAADAESATAAYVLEAARASRRFDGLALPPELARQKELLRLAQTVPAPDDEAARAELARLGASMASAYGKAKACDARDPQNASKCRTLQEVSRTLAKSRDYDVQLEAWKSWHDTGASIRANYTRWAEVANQGARALGFADVGELWRSGYDMSAGDLVREVHRLWAEVKPLYDELHCYTHGRLEARYGKEKMGAHGRIPAHLLGNMWAQEWTNLYPMLEPYPGAGSLDVSKRLADRKTTPVQMVKYGESFFTSLGFDPLPATFWERSMLSRPRDREVVCHASAWDVTWSDDLRIKMCIEPTEEDFVTVHHELGHNYYFHQYHTLPMLFQSGANDGFHEGIGDTLALSITPSYLKKLGLLDAVPSGDKMVVNQQLKTALQRVAFLPFGLLIDEWRWKVFSGEVKPEHMNTAWWALRREIQGVEPPVERGEDQFDPGAKYHVPGATPYLRYFLSHVYQFQFYRALCREAGHQGPLHACSFEGSKPAGEKLKAMLSLGASKPWQEAMALLGERGADASAILEYFAPLRSYLQRANAGKSCAAPAVTSLSAEKHGK
jgi:peptidyl-dipeptidase A